MDMSIVAREASRKRRHKVAKFRVNVVTQLVDLWISDMGMLKKPI